MHLAGHLALVTGAGSGIGRATCVALARDGASVAALDLSIANAEATLSIIAQAGGQGWAYECDVTNESQVASVVQQIGEAHGVADILVNCAGIGNRRPPLEVRITDWRRVIEVNLTGAFICSQAVIARLVKAGKPGVVINIASVAGEVAVPENTAYVASKHGLVGLTKSLALDCARMGIRVLAIAPGSVETPLTAALLNHPDAARRIGRTHPMGRWAQPEEIAELASFLASGRAAFMTGAVIPIDGGFLSGRPA